MAIKKILVPTDFSACAKNAEDYALALAKKMNAELHYYHSFHTLIEWDRMNLYNDHSSVFPSINKEELSPLVNTSLENINTLIAEKIKQSEEIGVTSKYFLAHNTIEKGIRDYIKSNEIDLVVMGFNGSGALSNEIIGSNTQKVVRIAKCPVIVLKEFEEVQDIDNILYASDFKEEAINKNLDRLKSFAELFDAKIHLLFVNTPRYFEDTESSINKMQKCAKEYNLTNFTMNIYNHFTADQGISKFASDNAIDLITITIHGYTGFTRLMNNNISEYVILETNKPVLVYDLK